MNNKKKFTLFSFLIFYLSLFILIPAAHAVVSCQPIYGGGQTCITTGNVIINKKVLNPANNAFVDSLGINDPKYAPGFIANFKLEITNSKDTNIARVEVKDIFPQYIEFATGPGTFDSQTKTLTFIVDNLAPNETRTFGIVGRVVAVNQLPVNQEIVCVVNQAIATTNEGAISQDNSQFCIEKKATIPAPAAKKGFPVFSPGNIITTPSTGPESLALLALIPIGITGWILRRYS